MLPQAPVHGYRKEGTVTECQGLEQKSTSHPIETERRSYQGKESDPVSGRVAAYNLAADPESDGYDHQGSCGKEPCNY